MEQLLYILLCILIVVGIIYLLVNTFTIKVKGETVGQPAVVLYHSQTTSI